MDIEFAYSSTIPGRRIVFYESTPRDSFLGLCVSTKMLLLHKIIDFL